MTTFRKRQVKLISSKLCKARTKSRGSDNITPLLRKATQSYHNGAGVKF